MLVYKATYRWVEGGVHAQVLDFPEAISCGSDLDDARQSLAGAMLDMAELRLELGEALPRPDPSLSDPEADVEEPIYLQLRISTRVEQVATGKIAG